MSIEIELDNQADTRRLARQLSRVLPVRCLVALNGVLGAGKTALVRDFATACGVSPREVTSPTFTLWQTYQGTRTIHHLDVYRIQDEDEFYALGVEEVMDEESTTFVEWANRVEPCLPRDRRLNIEIEVVSENQRRAVLRSTDPEINSTISTLT